MKTILLYGATGRTGQLIIEYALQKGYKIKALVRNPDKITIKSEYLSVIKGSPINKNDVRMAMNGCDFVINTLSALSEKESMSFKKIEAPHTLELSIRNTIKAMEEMGLKRIVTLSSIGVGNSRPLAPWYMKMFIKISNFKIVFDDHNAQEQLLMKSDLEWTIARPVALNNNKDLKTLVTNFDKTPSPFKMSRKQLAKFMVDTLKQNDFIKKAVVLSEK